MLRSRVASIDIIESSSGDTTVLPSSSVVLGMQFAGSVRAGETALTPAGVTGLQETTKTYSYAEGTGSVLVRFTAQGASCLGIPVSDLLARSVPLDAILTARRAAEALERLQEASDNEGRVAVVEELLATLPYRADPIVARAIGSIDDVTRDIGIGQLARELGLSERQLERRFLARVGTTPKRYASLRRFERAWSAASHGGSLTAAALAAGYFDQSHFIRDFRRFTGTSPRAFLARHVMSDSYNS